MEHVSGADPRVQPDETKARETPAEAAPTVTAGDPYQELALRMDDAGLTFDQLKAVIVAKKLAGREFNDLSEMTKGTVATVLKNWDDIVKEAKKP